jgi:hypothetical protein
MKPAAPGKAEGRESRRVDVTQAALGRDPSANLLRLLQPIPLRALRSLSFEAPREPSSERAPPGSAPRLSPTETSRREHPTLASSMSPTHFYFSIQQT